MSGVDAESWLRVLYGNHGRAIRAVAVRILVDPDRAEDVVQETLIRAWQHRANLDDPSRGSVRGWLVTTAHNVAVSMLRARSRRPPEVPESVESESARQVGDHAGPTTDQIVLQEALTMLSDDQRRVIELIYFADWPIKAVAAELGIPEGTVKSRAFTALKNLQRVMRQHEQVNT